MRLFPRVLLRWNEPRALRLAGYREGKRSLARIVPIVVLVALALVGVGARLGAGAAGRIALAAGAIIAIMYMFLWASRVFPPHVVVSEKGISRSVTSEDETLWKYETIVRCEIATTTVEGETIRVLVIETKRGDRSTLGIADSVPTEALVAVLESRGVRVRVADRPLGPDEL
jgi:hypothetical protein